MATPPVEIALFIVGATGAVVALFGSAILFYRLQRKYPNYYRKIGSPQFIAFPMYPTLGQQLSSMSYMFSLAYRGIPRNFPKNIQLVRLATVVRYAYYVFVFVWVILVFATGLVHH